ncbi:complement decay-accelerating factor-like isoform X2 [Pristis pectinata]|uniref:complement decay-accelerating factor-like isoform X2 n=1 Tax=Pristis pectinata TaxID=685728 RepID=UPI00223D70DA|nr:complement decay-accelerating factor-like isoform X2 [Pristis pectinata]
MAAGRLVLVLLAAAQVAGDCGKPPVLEDGAPRDEFLTQNTFAVGATVTYVCHSGFRFSEFSFPRVTCQENSTWTALRATCEPKSCGHPGDILNGYYNATSNTFGSKVTFYCNEGYRLVGRNYRLCESNGWSGQVPTCEVVKCPDLPPIANGTISGLGNEEFWEYGMIATYSCQHNLLLIGAEKITCGATGHWSADPPTCRDPSINTVSTPALVRRNTTSTPITTVRRNTTSTPITTVRRNTISTLNTTVRRNTTSTPATTVRSNTTSTLNTTVRRNTTSTPTTRVVDRNVTSTTLTTNTTSTAGHQYILFFILTATIYPVFSYD